MKLSREFLDHVSAAQGPTFYLLDSDQFRRNFSRLTTAFRNYYPNTYIAYSYKTNYIPRFCRLVEEMGGFAEVVSSMEMSLAQRLGISSSKIFFNGPYKEATYVRNLLSAGGIVNVDSMEELELIRSIAADHNGPAFRLGLRCNFEVNDGVLSRFGFDTGAAEFKTALKLIDEEPNLRLVGLHCHFASRTLECWKNRTKGMLRTLEEYVGDRLAEIEYVSLGGGMYGDMPESMKKQFPVDIPTFADYAAAAAKPFAEYFQSKDPSIRPVLIVEPGTALVADALKFACTVASIKHVRGRTIATLSGSTYNINPTPNRKNVPVSVFACPESVRATVNSAYLAGYTCIEGDYLYKDFSGELGVGDIIVFDDVGSYSVVMKPPFILPNVAVIEPDGESNSYTLIKRPETFDDVFHTYGGLS